MVFRKWYGAGGNLCTRKVVFAPNFDHVGEVRVVCMWTVEDFSKTLGQETRDTTTSLEPLDLEHSVAA